MRIKFRGQEKMNMRCGVSLIRVFFLLCAFFIVGSLLAEGQDKNELLQVRQEWQFDASALKQAVDESGEEEKEASVYGKVIFHYSNGASEEKGAFFKQSFDQGKYSSVAVEKFFDESVFLGNNLWMMLAACLVFIMHLGFAMVESGLTQAKNTVNILFKNTLIIGIGLLSYALMGFHLMYPADWNFIHGVFGFSGFGVDAGASGGTPNYNTGYTYWTDFLFQAMFAATCVTIVSGSVAERIRLRSFLIFSALYVTLVYPIVGSWQWGGGFLSELGFYDFAGSTIVHSVGGWGALAGVLLLGPRFGKYVSGSIRAIPGSSMPLATIGVFLLWFGWFGFNGGSVLSADPQSVSYVLVTTALAASAGMLGATLLSSLVSRKPDLSMSLNGVLAGLVGITAGADSISVLYAIIVGFSSGLLVVLFVLLLDRLRLDDPVGAISVHLVCGIWGTLCVGLFSNNAEHNLWSQFLGVGAVFLFAFPAAFIFFFIIRSVFGLRVSREEELKGLDISEHKQEAYSGFQIFDLR